MKPRHRADWLVANWQLTFNTHLRIFLSLDEFEFSENNRYSRVHRYGESVLIWNPGGFQELTGQIGFTAL